MIYIFHRSFPLLSFHPGMIGPPMANPPSPPGRNDSSFHGPHLLLMEQRQVPFHFLVIRF